MSQTKVEAELNFDSNASRLFAELKRDIAAVDQTVKDSKDNFGDFFRQFAAVTSANLLGPVIQNVKELSTVSFELGSHAYDTQHKLAGMMTAMAPQQWAQARGSAELLYHDIEKIGIALGMEKDAILAGHGALANFLGGTEHAFDVAGRNIEHLAIISANTGMSVQEMGAQFGKMAAGFVSTEAPMFNILKTTGIFHSDMSKVGSEWQKLTDAERIKRLESAIAGISSNLKDAPMTMSDMLGSIKESGAAFLEAFGGSVLRELLDNVDGLKNAINAGGEEFEHFAKSLGEDVGKSLAFIVDELTKAVDYLREHGAEIKQDIMDAFQFAKDVFSFILDNREALTYALGAAAISKLPGVKELAGPLGGAAMKAGKGLFATGTTMVTESVSAGIGGPLGGLNAMEQALLAVDGAAYNAAPVVTKVGQGALPALFGAIAAGGPPVWAGVAAFTALSAGLGYLVYKANKADDDRRKEIDRLIVRERERSETLEDLSTREFKIQEEERLRLIELAEQLGERTAAIKRLDEAGEDRRRMREQYVNPASVAAGNLSLMAQQGADPNLIRSQEELAVTEMTQALKKAVETGDSEVTKALMGILLDNERLKAAFMNTADTVAIGAEGIKLSLKALEEMGHEGGFLDKFFRSELAREFDGKAPKTQVTMNGTVIKVQQEFRDQDPDRVAVAFERRFQQAAISRVQASTSSAFGA